MLFAICKTEASFWRRPSIGLLGHAAANHYSLLMLLDESERIPPQTAALWRRFLLIAALLMAAAALYRVPMELGRLAFEPLGSGASTDLVKRFREVHAWFAGSPVYGVIESADYPPASYIVMYPLTHWPTLEITRLVWTFTSILALAWLCLQAVRESGATTATATWFAALLPLSAYATAATIRIGQMGIHLLPVLLAGTLLVARDRPSWKRDLVACGLLVAALVKPTFAVPFFWVAFFRGGIRFTTLAVGGYIALTLWGAAYQHDSLPTLIEGWLAQSGNVEATTAHANVFSWLGRAGLDQWYLPTSLFILAAAGVWTWRYRNTDAWLLVAVASIVARFWSYHRWYDDLLMLPPMIVLLQMIHAEERARRRDLLAMGLLVLNVGFWLAPAQVLQAPPPWSDLFKLAKTTTWLAVLALLLVRTHRASARST